MLPSYHDIIDRAGEPDWWDQHGAPRYGYFDPHMITVYGKRVSLYEIKCQSCGREFKVAHEWTTWDQTMRFREKFGGPPEDLDDDEAVAAWQAKYEDPDTAKFHYGDPPNHGCIGDTMNSEPQRCLEHWEREQLNWVRVPEKEVEVQGWHTQLDAHDAEPEADPFEDIPFENEQE